MKGDNMIRINALIPEEDKIELEKIAQKEERNLSWTIRKAIQEYIESHKEKEE